MVRRMSVAPVPVLYEDNHLLVVVKPPGLPVQADRSGDPDLQRRLKSYLKEKYQKPGNVFLGLVHRLDRPVGGVMVLGRTSKGAARLSEQIRNRTFRKTYIALLEGCPEPLEGRLSHWLLKERQRNVVEVVPSGTPAAREAILRYKVLSPVRETLNLIEIDLETGRPHQIRVQFASIGCPLVGDRKYGSTRVDCDLALWSFAIEFRHPTRDEIMRFEAPDYPFRAEPPL